MALIESTPNPCHPCNPWPKPPSITPVAGLMITTRVCVFMNAYLMRSNGATDDTHGTDWINAQSVSSVQSAANASLNYACGRRV